MLGTAQIRWPRRIESPAKMNCRIEDARAEYGEELQKQLAVDLTARHGSGISERNVTANATLTKS